MLPIIFWPWPVQRDDYKSSSMAYRLASQPCIKGFSGSIPSRTSNFSDHLFLNIAFQNLYMSIRYATKRSNKMTTSHLRLVGDQNSRSSYNQHFKTIRDAQQIYYKRLLAQRQLSELVIVQPRSSGCFTNSWDMEHHVTSTLQTHQTPHIFFLLL